MACSKKHNLALALNADNPKGFTRNGGTMRYYMYETEVSQVEWWEVIDEALDRGLCEPTGQLDGFDIVYNWKNP